MYIFLQHTIPLNPCNSDIRNNSFQVRWFDCMATLNSRPFILEIKHAIWIPMEYFCNHKRFLMIVLEAWVYIMHFNINWPLTTHYSLSTWRHSEQQPQAREIALGFSYLHIHLWEKLLFLAEFGLRKIFLYSHLIEFIQTVIIWEQLVNKAQHTCSLITIYIH